MTVVLSCPYCLGPHDGARICKHCGGDTANDAIVELTLETMDQEKTKHCIACKAKILALATHCRYCRAPQR